MPLRVLANRTTGGNQSTPRSRCSVLENSIQLEVEFPQKELCMKKLKFTEEKIVRNLTGSASRRTTSGSPGTLGRGVAVAATQMR
jgi:hypothetical protein